MTLLVSVIQLEASNESIAIDLQVPRLSVYRSQNPAPRKTTSAMSGIKETKLVEIDREMHELIQQEYNRQTGGLELIASEVRHLPPR